MNKTAYSRRQFLGWLGTAASIAVLPSQLAAAQRKVIVLGAGLSGLYAAHLLEQQGFEVVVIEARSRVGGRVYTLDDVPGHPEAGANIIGPNYGRTIHQAAQLGVSLESPQSGGGTGLIIDGQRIDRETWPSSPLNTLPEALRSVTPDRLSGALLRNNPLQGPAAWRSPAAEPFDISAASYFGGQGLGEHPLQWLNVNNSYGNRLEDTSLLSLYRVGASIALAMSMRQPVLEVAGGNMRLPQAMAENLANPVVTGEIAAAVYQTRTETRVQCESGAEFQADAVICALPATAVRKIRFEPGLPAENWQAFQTVNYHKTTQAHLLASEPYWEASNSPSSWWTNGPLGRIFTRSQPNEAGSYNITVWINGDGCDRFDVMNEQEAGASIMEEFQRLIPASGGRVELAKLVRWANDPFSQGTWAVWRPGEIARMPALLSEQYDRVFFAGEHTAIANSGMEGAMESSDRVVLETMRRLA